MKILIVALTMALVGCIPDWGAANTYTTCIDKIVAPTAEQIASCEAAAAAYQKLRP